MTGGPASKAVIDRTASVRRRPVSAAQGRVGAGMAPFAAPVDRAPLLKPGDPSRFEVGRAGRRAGARRPDTPLDLEYFRFLALANLLRIRDIPVGQLLEASFAAPHVVLGREVLLA